MLRPVARGAGMRVPVLLLAVDAADDGLLSPPKIRRGAIAKVNLANFRSNTRQTWIFRGVESCCSPSTPPMRACFRV